MERTVAVVSCPIFRLSATVSQIGLMESRLGRRRGGPPLAG